jgi:hypothetical protein
MSYQWEAVSARPRSNLRTWLLIVLFALIFAGEFWGYCKLEHKTVQDFEWWRQ